MNPDNLSSPNSPKFRKTEVRLISNEVRRGRKFNQTLKVKFNASKTTRTIPKLTFKIKHQEYPYP
jgi:hypothetical protein